MSKFHFYPTRSTHSLCGQSYIDGPTETEKDQEEHCRTCERLLNRV